MLCDTLDRSYRAGAGAGTVLVLVLCYTVQYYATSHCKARGNLQLIWCSCQIPLMKVLASNQLNPKAKTI